MRMKSIVLFVLIVKIIVKAEGTTCGVIPITEWGGSPLKREEILPGPVDIAVIQHTATPECNGDEECQRAVVEIRKLQIQRGFDDIGPSFLIGGNGKVYEGAGWKYVGAHTLKYNQRAVGITFIGDFTSKLPSPLAQKALHKLLASGVENKFLTEGYHLVAHNQLSQTLSPGDTLRKQVETWPHWLDNPKARLG